MGPVYMPPVGDSRFKGIGVELGQTEGYPNEVIAGGGATVTEIGKLEVQPLFACTETEYENTVAAEVEAGDGRITTLRVIAECKEVSLGEVQKYVRPFEKLPKICWQQVRLPHLRRMQLQLDRM
jgi:hypothetical protein